MKRPRMPVGMPAAARRLWQSVLPKLMTLGVISEIDGYALERWVRMAVDWRRMQKVIDQKGEIVELTDGEGQLTKMKIRPEVMLRDQLGVQLQRLEQQFGMTPSARTRLTLVDPDAGKLKDPFARLVS